jgi:hypothetical protein
LEYTLEKTIVSEPRLSLLWRKTPWFTTRNFGKSFYVCSNIDIPNNGEIRKNAKTNNEKPKHRTKRQRHRVPPRPFARSLKLPSFEIVYEDKVEWKEILLSTSNNKSEF